MSEQEIIEAVTDFANRAHGLQRRKYSGEHYIVHPIRVMKLCSQYTEDMAILCAALLHDVLEDTSVSANEMTTFISSVAGSDNAVKTVQLVIDLTDVYTKQSHPHLKRRKRKELEAQRLSLVSADAHTIKYADLIDNCQDILLHDRNFATIYFRESQMFLQAMTRGNSSLYATARQVVDAGILSFK